MFSSKLIGWSVVTRAILDPAGLEVEEESFRSSYTGMEAVRLHASGLAGLIVPAHGKIGKVVLQVAEA
jgi:hypothetical protein